MSELPVIFDSDKMNQLYKACEFFSKSQLVPYALRGKPQDILVILTMAHELNVPPMQAMTQINVIQGKPTISPQLMIGLVRAKLPSAVIKWEIDEAQKRVSCIAARSKEEFDDGLSFISTWDMTRAQAMGLSSKDNYKKQALTMLKWRATGEALRTVFPDLIMGLYVEQEFRDFDGKEVEQRQMDELLEEDFPIPENEKEPGPDYRFQYGKFRGKQVKDCDPSDLEKYLDVIEPKIGTDKESRWHKEVAGVINQVLSDIERQALNEQ